MEPATFLSKDETEFEFIIECDERGFCVNCNVIRGEFDTSIVPSVLLSYTRQLCKELGISFESALRSSLGVPPKDFRGPVGEA